MSSSVRVSNIPKEATEDIIHSLFLSFGNILSIKSNKNYIDIQFQDIEDSKAALVNMNGFELYDRYLQVSKIQEHNPLDTIEKNKAIWEQSNEFNQRDDE